MLRNRVKIGFIKWLQAVPKMHTEETGLT